MSCKDDLTDQILKNTLKEQAAKGPDLRQQHPKSHGLLHGEFKVECDIPKKYKVGVFAQPQIYPIWIRFSNGSPAIKRGILPSDTEGDALGMAIKLMKVPGDKVLDDELLTQDFILANHPVFFIPDVQGYIDFNTFREQKAQGNPDPELLKKLKPCLAIREEIKARIVGNPLLIQYWSMTPYKLGDHRIKFSVKPHKPEQPPSARPDSPNYLREAIVKYFNDMEDFNDMEESVKFDFQIQVYVDNDKTPMENPMVEWKEANCPPIKVATIEIPKQPFDFEERKRYDDILSFSPWHTLLEHEPLGSVNLARKTIYQESAKHRRAYIQERFREPKSYESIKDDPYNMTINLLNFIVPIAAPVEEHYHALKKLLKTLGDHRDKFDKIGTVHFARFLFLGKDTTSNDEIYTQLALFTTYDGAFELYIQDFVDEVGDLFNALLEHLEGGKAVMPVKDNVQAFTDYVHKYDLKEEHSYKAYTNVSVRAIVDKKNQSHNGKW